MLITFHPAFSKAFLSTVLNNIGKHYILVEDEIIMPLVLKTDGGKLLNLGGL